LFFSEDVVGRDIGAAGKFALCYEWDGYIFTVDDDFIYPIDYISKSIDKIEEYNRSVILSYHGRLQKIPATAYRGCGSTIISAPHIKTIEEDVVVNIIGTGLMFFHSDTITPKYDIMEMRHTNVSDIYFSMAMNKRKIPLIVAKHKSRWIEPLENGLCIKNSQNEKWHVDLINSYNWNNVDR